MKVFFVLDSLANAGTENSTLDIVSNFTKNTQVTIIYHQLPETLKQQYLDANILLLKLTSNSFLKCFYQLKKIIKIEKPNLIVSSLFKSNILCRCVCFFTKTILIGTFVNDTYGKERALQLNKKQKIANTFYKGVDKLTSKIPKYYISNSESIKHSNCKALSINKNKVKVIFRGRDSNKINLWVNPFTDVFRFIIISRVLNRKGFGELIEAIKIVNKKNKNIELHIYGDGNYVKALKEKITKYNLNEVVFLKGNIVNAYQFVNTAHCFVFTSWYEGLSGALIEAAISGIPIIASNISMNKEVINGLPNAMMHKIKNAESIAECMFEVINNFDNYAKSNIVSREKAIAKFDIKTIAKKYEEFLQSV